MKNQKRNGEWISKEDEVAAVFIDYFSRLFQTSHPSQMEDILDAVPKKVTAEMNNKLDQVLTKEEVIQALDQMHPMKAQNPDGLSTLFFTNSGL